MSQEDEPSAIITPSYWRETRQPIYSAALVLPFILVYEAGLVALRAQVINGFSDLILALYGPERGQHARSAVGRAALPFRIPVEIEAEVEIDGQPPNASQSR